MTVNVCASFQLAKGTAALKETAALTEVAALKKEPEMETREFTEKLQHRHTGLTQCVSWLSASTSTQRGETDSFNAVHFPSVLRVIIF